MRFALVVVIAGCTARGQVAASLTPPAVRVETMLPRPGHVWVAGSWALDGAAWLWISGYWTVDATPASTTPPQIEIPNTPATPDPGRAAIAWVDATDENQEIFVRQWDGQRWNELGTSAHVGGISHTGKRHPVSDEGGASQQPAIALDAAGHPVVAWTERLYYTITPATPTSGRESTARDEIYLRRWTGTSWEELAGSGHGGGLSDTPYKSGGAAKPSIAIDHQGRIVVAYQVADLVHSHIWVVARRWDGKRWEPLGGIDWNAGVSRGFGGTPALTIDGEDRPVVAWQCQQNACDIYVRRWNGQTWDELDGSASGRGVSSTGGVAEPEITTDRAGHVVVMWPPAEGHGSFGARRWLADHWELLSDAPAVPSCTAGLFYSLAIDGADEPIVATHSSNLDGSYLLRWSNGWRLFPRPNGANRALMLTGDGQGGVFAAWFGQHSELRAARWNGQAWRDLGTLYREASPYPVAIAATLPR